MHYGWYGSRQDTGLLPSRVDSCTQCAGSLGIPRIVAIYPRVELLRDQLRALLELVTDLEGRDAGRMRVGVLYGATPQDKKDAVSKGWRSTADGLTSPIVGCLRNGCTGDLVWPNDDSEGRRLLCSKCGFELESPCVLSPNVGLIFSGDSLHDNGDGESDAWKAWYAAIVGWKFKELPRLHTA